MQFRGNLSQVNRNLKVLQFESSPFCYYTYFSKNESNVYRSIKNESYNINKLKYQKMADGYIYCFSNSCMPGILKVGMTERTPGIRLREANSSDTWRPPTPYKIEFAKRVSNASLKENTLHTLLEQYTERVNPRREFFRVSAEEVQKFFDLMDGEIWTQTHEEGEEEEEEESSSSDSVTRVKSALLKGCRDMSKCFTNGQRIRHKIGINRIWIGTYDYSRNVIVCDGKIYNSPSGLAAAHNKIELPHRITNTANGWQQCECEVDGAWISIYSPPG